MSDKKSADKDIGHVGGDADERLAQARREGLSPMKTAELMFGDMDNEELTEFGRHVKYVSLVKAVCGVIAPGSDFHRSTSLAGLVLIFQGYMDHPQAVWHRTKLMELKSVYDTICWILNNEGGTPEQYFQAIKSGPGPDLDEHWFISTYSQLELEEYMTMAYTEVSYKSQLEVIHAEIARNHADVMERERIHHILMSD